MPTTDLHIVPRLHPTIPNTMDATESGRTIVAVIIPRRIAGTASGDHSDTERSGVSIAAAQRKHRTPSTSEIQDAVFPVFIDQSSLLIHSSDGFTTVAAIKTLLR